MERQDVASSRICCQMKGGEIGGLGVHQNTLGQTHQTLPCPQYTQHIYTSIADHSKLIIIYTTYNPLHTIHTNTFTQKITITVSAHEIHISYFIFKQ